MPREHLKQTLVELHAELGRSASLDDETKNLLAEVLADIRDVLASEVEPTGETLATRLRDATEDFESSHPTLTALVNQVTEALGRAGI